MRWTRPHHGRWLAACLVAFLLSGSFGGFNASIAMVFLVIFVVGAVLLSPGDADGDAEGDLGDDAEIEDSGEGDTETEAVVDQQDLEADEPTADADGHGEPATGIADEPDDPDGADDPDDPAADASEPGADAPSENQSRPAGTPDQT